MPRQLTLFCSRTEAELFHNQKHSGFVSLLVQLPDRKHQSSHLLNDLPRVLEMMASNRDTWISQAEFTRPNRRVVNLLRIGLLFADLDTYRMPWAVGGGQNSRGTGVLCAASLHPGGHSYALDFDLLRAWYPGQMVARYWVVSQPG